MKRRATRIGLLSLFLPVTLPGCTPSPDGEQSTRSAPLRAEGCYALTLGPSASAERAPVDPPAWVALLPDGRLGGGHTVKDTMVELDSALGQWSRVADSLWITWTPAWLAGSMALRLVADSDAWRGRYSLHGHQVDDGRILTRGDARAAGVPCENGALRAGPELTGTIRQLKAWRNTTRPDTTAGVTEALQAFEAFLRETPVHSLSLMNYRIATFACLNQRLPASIAEIQAVESLPPVPVRALERRSFRDAWGRPLQYRRLAVGYEVRSAGPDGQTNSSDDLVSAEAAPLRRSRETNCR